MERPAGMVGQPFEDFGLLVGGVVVDDGVDDLPGRDSALDGVEEADELLVAMPAHAAPDHGPIEDVERGEQRGRAVALVIVLFAAALAWLRDWLSVLAKERLGESATACRKRPEMRSLLERRPGAQVRVLRLPWRDRSRLRRRSA